MQTAMIEQLKDFPDNVVACVCKGQVTKADYDTVLIPAVNTALQRHDKVRFYYETTPDFAGIDPGAMWEDFKVGLAHWLRWERIAIVTDVHWIKRAVRFWGFLVPGPLRTFSTAEAVQARRWIVAND
jgi:SpoIIAA-like